MIEDQQQRLKALGPAARRRCARWPKCATSCKRVSQERDELRKQLTRVDSMQTATIALPEDDRRARAAPANVPSLDDLMGALGDIESPRGTRVAGHLHQRVQRARATTPRR